ncbi:N-methylhydantoinase A [Prauserella sediminis]|uniref:N-methylhydantoinase A n=1 Tax=Prauserella sediminis TaxID=577680 RepID=A0A839XWP3_9PSEU|nr:hydantoinase/oxoprolinase family protein [Prauserella sediminis]MBB3664446.1 N-methylhydantoinase A [Prauserella sediminis]
MSFTIAVDVGGTFTDVVATDGTEVFAGKVSSRPNDEATAVLNAVDVVAEHFGRTAEETLAVTDQFILGTTVVTNAMLEYKGVPTGLITTKGFRDVLEIRRGYKESIFDLSLPAPHPITRRRFRKGVTERIDYRGDIATPLDEDEVRSAVRELKDAGIESIAVCLLFSFVNDTHERRIAEIIAEEHPTCFVTLSCDVLPQIREFERVSTTVVNAYTSPLLKSYLQRLDEGLRNAGFVGELVVMQSNGGIMDVAYSAGHGVDAVLSGPAGGVVAASALGERSGYRNIITGDMGGTSYDVCLIHQGKPEIGVENWISRYRVAVPLVDIHTIGSGGGSIAWVDDGGALRIGPESAGANPGPACYGRGGTRPTVTDANLLLGFMDQDRFMGGQLSLDRAAAERAFEEHVAKPMGISVLDAAVGVFRVANSEMANALRFVSVSRGRDPRDYALMAFGGAGAIHAGVQAVDLGIKTVLVPRKAAVLSAFGGLVADFKVSRIKSYVRAAESVRPEELTEVFDAVCAEAEELLPNAETSHLERYLDVRYEGQTREVVVPIRTRTRRISDVSLSRALNEFHELHDQLYGHQRPDQPVQIVSARVDLTGVRSLGDVTPPHKFTDEDSSPAQVGMREVYFEGRDGFVETPIFDGALVEPGHVITGPAVIHEPGTTIVVSDGQEAMLDQYETYVIEVVR